MQQIRIYVYKDKNESEKPLFKWTLKYENVTQTRDKLIDSPLLQLPLTATRGQQRAEQEQEQCGVDLQREARTGSLCDAARGGQRSVGTGLTGILQNISQRHC